MSKKDKNNIGYMLILITQIGISMIVPIALCTYLGILVNRFIVGNAICVLFFIIFGIVVAFRNTYILVKNTFIDDVEKENKEIKYYKDMEDERKKRLGK